jgi:hypothetical protein
MRVMSTLLKHALIYAFCNQSVLKLSANYSFSASASGGRKLDPTRRVACWRAMECDYRIWTEKALQCESV